MSLNINRRSVAFLLFFQLVICIASPSLHAADEFIEVRIRETIDQNLYSDMACGPAVILSLLANSERYRPIYNSLPGEGASRKLTKVILKYGYEPITSEDSQEGSQRFDEEKGIWPQDLTDLAVTIIGGQPITTPKLLGQFLDIKEEERTRPGSFIRRIHRLLKDSLTQGTPVVVSLRSFAPVIEEGKPVWEGLANHFVLVTKIPAELKPQELGFIFEYLDPNGGIKASGYIYEENIRPFNALKEDRTSRGEWIQNGFLLVNAPSLRTLSTGGVPWGVRTIITLNYAISDALE